MKIKRGIYRHFQGDEFRVTGLGRHTESGEEEVVLSQYGPKTYEKDIKWWVCPQEKFVQEVLYDGQMVPRFRLVLDFEQKINKKDFLKKGKVKR